MNVKRKSLGKGLDALLGLQDEQDIQANVSQPESGQGFKNLPIEWLQPGEYQPRSDIVQRSLDELADSIREQGIVQPILVRALGGEQYEIVAGERRWRAAQLAGLSTVPTIIKVLSDQETLAISLIENIQRENLNAMEEARALVRLQSEFGYNQQQVARAVGKSRSAVANLMRLTALQSDVAVMLENGDLEMGHCRALLALEGKQQADTARIVASKGLSVRETEALVRRILKHKGAVYNQASPNADIAALEQRVSELLGAGVKIAHRTGGKGKITISYNNLDELDGILEHIK